jgi:hypothetical protein
MCGSVSKTMTHDYCVITLVEGFEEKTVMHLTYSTTHGPDLIYLWLFTCNIRIRSNSVSTHCVMC